MGMLWHYVQNGRSLGPVPEEQLKALLASGALRPEDLVWHEGMANWIAARSIPELQPPVAPIPLQANAYAAPQASLNPPFQPAPMAAGAVSEEAVELLRKTKPWVRLFSVLGMIGIAMMALGAVVMALMSFGPFKVMPLLARLGIGLVYLLLACLYVPPVLFLHRYASRIRDLMDDPSFQNLEDALRAQKSFWKYIGMFTIIGICVYLLVLVGVLVTGVVMGMGNRVPGM